MFKRNQVEEAIAIVLEPGSAKPGSEIRTRLKRLLETDRSLGRSKRSADPERANFAFHSMDAPGRGRENWFTGYEAFALLTGLRLMRDDWPQGLAVAALRRVKPDLERHHARILRQDATLIFNEPHVRQHAKPGDLAVSNADPVFLVIKSKDQEDRLASNPAAICRGQAELMRFIMGWGPGQTWTVMELGTSIHGLSLALAKTAPRKRGRGSR
jgi:hypothetical protein